MICIYFESHTLCRVSKNVFSGSRIFFKCFIFPFPSTARSQVQCKKKKKMVLTRRLLVGFPLLAVYSLPCCFCFLSEKQRRNFCTLLNMELAVGTDPELTGMVMSCSVSALVKVGGNLYGQPVSKHTTVF